MNQITPPQILRSLSLAFIIALGLGVVLWVSPVRALTGGPDAHGYMHIDSTEPGGPTYNFEDISGTGTVLNLGDDQMSSAIPIGFTFYYYGTAYTDIYVSSNGFLTVLPGQSHGCCTGGEMPAHDAQNAVIAGWWEDLNPPGGGSIHYQTLGNGHNRRLIVQFTNIEHFPSGNPVTLQFKLFEGTAEIEVHYQAAPSDAGIHSAGIENQDSTTGLQYYLDSGPLSTPLAVRYYLASPNVYLTPGSTAKGGRLGTTVVYTETLINRTGIDDGFDLMVSGNVWSTTLSITNTGTIPDGGSLDLAVRVAIPAGASLGDTDVVTVTTISVTSPTVYSGTATVTTGASCLGYVFNRANNRIRIVDTFSHADTGRSIDVTAYGAAPLRGAISPDGRWLYIGLQGSDLVLVVDVATDTAVANLAVGSGPHGIGFSADGAYAFVANQGSANVSVIYTNPPIVVATLPVGSRPMSIGSSPYLDKVYVVNHDSSTVSVIDLATLTVVDVIAGLNTPWGIAFSPDGQRAYVTNQGNSSIGVIDTASDSLIATWPIGAVRLAGLDISPDGSTLYTADAQTNSVYVVDTTTGAVVTTVRTSSLTNWDVELFPAWAGPFAYVSGSWNGTVEIIDTSTNNLIGTIPSTGGDVRGLALFPPPRPEIRIFKTADPTAVAIGDPLTYTLTFQANETSSNVIITDVIPSCMTAYTYTNTGVTITRTGSISYTWLVGDLAPGEGGVITITGIVNPSVVTSYVFANTATMSNSKVINQANALVWLAIDYGDAPDPTYPTLLASNGAHHFLGSGPFLGGSVDPDLAGQPSAAADGDDTDGNDDEDGVTFVTALLPGEGAVVDVDASAAGFLDAWIDFNADGDWADPGEQIFAARSLAPGSNVLPFPIPLGAVPGLTFARFRLSSVGGLPFNGSAPDGEVEDYQVLIAEVDLGDAPDPTYPTLRASDGARHIILPGFFLGASADADPDGQPSATATGDDVLDGNDDEDGVTFTSGLNPGFVATVDVVASAPGLLDAWIDFNADGDWADLGEQIFASQGLGVGTNNLALPVPIGATLGPSFARFRFSTVGGTSYDGLVPDGEVEDYQVKINASPTADAGVDQSVGANAPVTLDGSGSYDPDNDLPLSYSWMQTGGTPVVLSSATVSQPTFTASDDPDVLTFTLTVTDALGLADATPDEVVITVTNQAPVADAGVDQSVGVNAPATLDGSGSYDPDNDLPLTYGWMQTGGTPVVLSSATVSQPTFTAPDDPDVLIFTLTVTDALGLADATPDEVMITIANQSPVADAGVDQRVGTNALVTLDGSGSYDPDNNLPLTYGWTQTGGTPVILSSAAVAHPTFTAPKDSTILTFTLTVTDTLGLVDATPDEVVVVVGNQSPVADAGVDQSVGVNAPVTLDGSGSHDPDNDLPLSYGWMQTGGTPVVLSSATVSQPTFTAPDDPDVLTFTLTVTDALGLADATPDEVMITIYAPELGITKSIVGAGGGMVNLPLGGVVTYTIELANSGEGIAYDVVMIDALPSGVGFGRWVQQGLALPPAPTDIITWGPYDILAGESHTICFTVNISDDEAFVGQTITNTTCFSSTNAGSRSDDAIFTVVPLPNTPPTIFTIPNQFTTLHTRIVVPFTINDNETALHDLLLSAASASPTLVPTTSIVFGGLGANRTVTITPTADLVGTATITITVTDDGGLTDDTSFVLTVEPYRIYLPITIREKIEDYSVRTRRIIHFELGRVWNEPLD